MTTLKVTVDNYTHAHLLSELLCTMRFVKKVEEDIPYKQQANSRSQFQNLKKLLDSVKKGELFKEIENPAEWQKKLRDEWK